MLQSIKIFVQEGVHAFLSNLQSEVSPNPTSKTDPAPLQALFQSLQIGSEASPSPAPTAAALSPEQLAPFKKFIQEIGLGDGSTVQFPEKNPLTATPINWEKEIRDSNLQTMQRESTRKAKEKVYSQNAKTNRLIHLMLIAIQSGNISLAMMLFSHLEAQSANELTKALMEKVHSLQDHKRELTRQLQSQKNDAEGSKAMQKIKTDIEQANDDISVLQTFIRDVAQNKQYAIELANAFIQKEHETTMAVVRGFAR